jgi:hypothetical protein
MAASGLVIVMLADVRSDQSCAMTSNSMVLNLRGPTVVELGSAWIRVTVLSKSWWAIMVIAEVCVGMWNCLSRLTRDSAARMPWS